MNILNDNASDIKSTLETTASGVGTTLSDKMGTIWTITNDCKSVVSTYSGNFDTAAGEVNSNLGTINTTVSQSVSTIASSISNSYANAASSISSSISGLASNIDGLKGALTKTDNSGDASNPDDNSSGGSGGSGGSSGGNNIKEYAPDTIITDTNKTTEDTSKTKDTSKETTKTETPKVKSNEEIIAEKIVKFGDASGRGMNAEKSGDNGIITWNGKEYKVQNSGTAHDSSTPLYKAAVNVLGFSDRQIFGYGGKVYGYLDNHIQEIEGRFWSKKGYENFVSDMQAHYPAYKDGGLIDYTGLAWVDGTKEKPEMVLNAEETKALSSIHEWLPALAKKYENITFADAITPAGYFAPMSFASNAPDYSDKLSQIQNNHNETKVEQNFEITIPIEKVEDYNDFVTKLRDDPKFEKMIQSMTIGRINGGSPNAKYSYSWKNK